MDAQNPAVYFFINRRIRPAITATPPAIVPMIWRVPKPGRPYPRISARRNTTRPSTPKTTKTIPMIFLTSLLSASSLVRPFCHIF
jgi:hypothetical protein